MLANVPRQSRLAMARPFRYTHPDRILSQHDGAWKPVRHLDGPFECIMIIVKGAFIGKLNTYDCRGVTGSTKYVSGQFPFVHRNRQHTSNICDEEEGMARVPGERSCKNAINPWSTASKEQTYPGSPSCS